MPNVDPTLSCVAVRISIFAVSIPRFDARALRSMRVNAQGRMAPQPMVSPRGRLARLRLADRLRFQGSRRSKAMSLVGSLSRLRMAQGPVAPRSHAREYWQERLSQLVAEYREHSLRLRFGRVDRRPCDTPQTAFAFAPTRSAGANGVEWSITCAGRVAPLRSRSRRFANSSCFAQQPSADAGTRFALLAARPSVRGHRQLLR